MNNEREILIKGLSIPSAPSDYRDIIFIRDDAQYEDIITSFENIDFSVTYELNFISEDGLMTAISYIMFNQEFEDELRYEIIDVTGVVFN